MNCATCRGRLHVFHHDTRRWSRCSCVGGVVARAAANNEGVTEIQPLAASISKFVRGAFFSTEAHLIYTTPAQIETLARSIAHAAMATADLKTRVVRLGDAVDARFDRGQVPALKNFQPSSPALLVLICGTEMQTKINASVFVQYVGQRNAATKPTVVLTTEDPVGLYGGDVVSLVEPMPTIDAARPTPA